MKKERRLGSLLLALIMLVSVWIPGLNIISASEEFDIPSNVIYNEDNTEATISLDVANIGTNYVVEQIKDSDGNSLDVGNPIYTVTKNGTYIFDIQYKDTENIKYDYQKEVQVEGIEKVKGVHSNTLLTPRSGAVDYTDQVDIEDWNLVDSNGLPVSQTHAAVPFTFYQYTVSWTLTPNNGEFLHADDTFSISLPLNSIEGSWIASNSEWENFMDASNVVLGQWRIYNNKIEVILTSGAEGKLTINGSFETGKSSIRNGTSRGGMQSVTSGNKTKELLFNQLINGDLPNYDTKGPDSSSNSRIKWIVIVNNLGVNELSTQPWGTNFTIQNNVYLEDTLNGKYGEGLGIMAYSQIPQDLTTGKASGAGNGINVLSKFQKINPQVGETYVTFKARLAPFQYGIYTEGDGTQRLVINFGDIGSDGPKYSEIDPDFAEYFASITINRGNYNESDRDELINYYNTVYGDDNVIGGKIVKYRVIFNEDYPKVLNDSEKTNIATISKNGIEQKITGKVVLQGMNGSAKTVDAGKAGVHISDADDSSLLEGINFKLQIKNGSDWEDYTGWTGAATNDEGFVETSSLGYGTYRFVQQNAFSTDYDLTNSDGYDTVLGKVVSEEFTIALDDTQGQILEMTNVKKKFTITYTKGTKGDFSNNVHNNVVIHTNTPAFNGTKDSDGKPKGLPGYSFIGWAPSVIEKVSGNATYTAQWEADTNTVYKVEHYLEQLDGSYIVEDTENLAGTTDTTAIAIPKTTYTGYTHDSSINGTKPDGIITGDGSLTLRLYYKLTEHTVTYQPGTKGDFSNNIHSHIKYGSNTPGYNGVLGSDGKPKGLPGYTFTGWNPIVTATVTSNVTYEAKWSVNTDTAYKVEHHLEQLDGSYIIKETENLTGTTAAMVHAVAKSYTGYVVNILHSDRVTSGEIAGDGTLTLRIFYSLTRHTITYKPGDKGIFEEEIHADIKYGSDVPIFTGTIKGLPGYSFMGWDKELITLGKVTEDAIYTAIWDANTDTLYNVEYYLQESDGNYTLKEKETLSGTTDTLATATIKNYDGYTHKASVEGTKLSGNIEGDGSLLLKVYYTKNERVITYNLNATPASKESNKTRVSTGDSLDYKIYIGILGISLIGLLIVKKKFIK